VDIYIGPRPPAGREANWIKTASGRNWFPFFTRAKGAALREDMEAAGTTIERRTHLVRWGEGRASSVFFRLG
jgi:hypothetical protein